MNSRSLKDSAIEFLTLVASGKISEAYDRHVGAAFRHHNPYFRGDAKSLKEGMQANAIRNPDKVFEVQRALQEGDVVAVHSRVQQSSGELSGAVVHIFRFEGGRIVELWDIGQQDAESPVNENGMF